LKPSRDQRQHCRQHPAERTASPAAGTARGLRDTARTNDAQENVEAVQLAYAALNRGDIPTLLGLCHPDVVFDNTNAAFDAGI
jgi:hypothetical protein